MLNTVGQSPLGAFIESALGARTVEGGEEENVRVQWWATRGSVSPFQVSVSALNPDDMSFRDSPVPLKGFESNVSSHAYGIAPDPVGVCVVVYDVIATEIRGYDHGGNEVWSFDPTHSDGNFVFQIVTIGVVESNGVNLFAIPYYYASGHQVRVRTFTLDDGVEVDDVLIVDGSNDVVCSSVAGLNGKFYLIVSFDQAGDDLQTLYELEPDNDDGLVVSRSNDVGSDTWTNVSGAFRSGQFATGDDPDFVYTDALIGTLSGPKFRVYHVADLSHDTALDYDISGTAPDNGIPVPIHDDSGLVSGNFVITVQQVHVDHRKYDLDDETLTAIVSHSGPRLAWHASSDYTLAPASRLDVPSIDGVDDERFAAYSVGGEPYSRTVTATGANIKWVLSSGPTGMTIDADTGVLIWAEPAAGNHSIEVRALSSLIASDTESWTLAVQDDPPVIAQEADDSGTEGFPYSNTINRDGGQGDLPITWTLDEAPGDSYIVDNSSSASFGWDSPEAGVHTVTVRATNAAGFDTMSFELTIEDQTVAPVINDVADASASDGGLYFEPVSLSAGDTPCTWSLEEAPEGMLIGSNTNESNAVFWTAAPGVHTVTVRCTNGAGFDTETWQVTVS